VSLGHALKAETACFGIVHSVFIRAVNLTIDGDMWTVLGEEKADLPYGIRVALPAFDTLGLHRGDQVRVRSGFVGIGSRLIIDCRAAPRWSPACATEPLPGLESRLRVVAGAACGRSWPGSAPMAHAVRSVLNDATALRDVLAKVIGRGPGATPSGDDVLVGALAVLTSRHSGRAGARAAESLRRPLHPLLSTTTDVSGHLLRQAANGLFCRDMHELIGVLIEGPSFQQLHQAVRRVIETGATSGADTCEGLLAFAPSYFERASA
jgi:hypothetical protein